jgi:SAM-dependent methyltransferase
MDWGHQWTGAFLEPLRQADVGSILDLGCGTGNEVMQFTRAGFAMTGLDYSSEAIGQARSKAGSKATFVVADMAQALPFPTATFDAVMSNVAAHMFCDAITRALFAEVRRVVRPGGLFLFHVNALEDRPLRAKRISPVREMEANYVLEQTGQTMHFFSKEYLLDLLAEWREVNLEAVVILDRETGQPFKQVWRGVVQR